MQLRDQVALITGSAQGIGKEIAKTFAKEGATAVICDVNAELARTTSDEFTKQGLNSTNFSCDVTNLQSVEEMVNKILDKYKRIDILINNAGITKDNLLLRMSVNEWDAVLSVNLKGTFNCTKVVTKPMLKASAKRGSASGGKKGKIINIASIIGIMGNAGQVNYAASKAGIIGFTKSIAREFASRGITANCVAPGYIQTEMTEKLSDKAREEIFKNIPLGKLGTPGDVAGVCMFLASKDADYITGQTIVVDGGLAM